MAKRVMGLALAAGLAAVTGTSAQDKNTVPATLTDATFIMPFRGVPDQGNRVLNSSLTTQNTSLFPPSTVWKVPATQTISLRFDRSRGYFAAPIVVSMNPLVRVVGSGKDETSAVRIYGTVLKSLIVSAVPTAPTQVEIRVHWGGVTKRVFWVVAPAAAAAEPPPAPPLPPPALAPALVGPSGTVNTSPCPNPPNPRFTWNAVRGATGYTIEYRNRSKNRTQTRDERYTNHAGLHFITGDQYDWRVRGRNVSGVGPWSPRLAFRGVAGGSSSPCLIGRSVPFF